jgi:energy-coupling factor transporter ATP-binding protein EcfA2
MTAGAGLLCGTNDLSSFTVISPSERTALVVVSPEMLRFPYHTRYELIEFAVYTLASRTQELVPLHAACVGRKGRGLLLIGPSGSGKSTVALHCLLQGLDFLSEDSVFVKPDTLLATGAASFLHVRRDSLRFLTQASHAARIRKSPVIQRRSGVRKFEVDLRRGGYKLADVPLAIEAVIFTSAEKAGNAPLLRPLRASEMLAQLRATQPYAASRPQWSTFTKSLLRVRAFELRRGRHPLEAVSALRELIDAP